MHVDVSPDRLNRGNRWPEASFGIQYTLGMCLNINGKWYCSPGPVLDRFTSGRRTAESDAQNWFYDPARWSPMTGHQPSVGEMIGFFLCAGDCRNNVSGDLSPVEERSNVVLVPFPGGGGGSYNF